jgi:transcriptional regulator with XRE-family HTH domain
MLREISQRFKTRRKALKLTQKELSQKSGVSLGSIKRFEQSGQIAFESLLKLALVLECLEDFEEVCGEREVVVESLGDINDN